MGSCYGHVSTDVSSPEGGDHMGDATSLSGEAALLDLRQCSSSPTVELSSKSGRGTTMIGTMSTGPCLMPHARDRSGTRATTWAQATALPTRASPAAAMATVWETSSVLAARFLFANKSLLFIFSLKESMQKDQIVLCLENKKTVCKIFLCVNYGGDIVNVGHSNMFRTK